jgi:cell division protein FtsI (penicillin-binding protein 3)
MPGERLISERTSAMMRRMMREVVTRGTGLDGRGRWLRRRRQDRHRRQAQPASGGYYKDRVINTFAGAFPATTRAMCIVVTLDEPIETMGTEVRRTAGWTAVPVAAEIVRRTAPLSGPAPDIELAPPRLKQPVRY